MPWDPTASKEEQKVIPKQTNLEFSNGFIHGIRDVLIITVALFILFLIKVPALVFLRMLSFFGQFTYNLWLEAALLYFLISFVLNMGFKIFFWLQKSERCRSNIIGHTLGSLISTLVVAPFAFPLAAFAFLLFLGPISI